MQAPASRAPNLRLESLHHIRNLRSKDTTFLLQRLDGLHEQLVAVPLPRALNREDKMVFPAAELDLALEFWMP